jgi:hypothetical protein
MGGRAGGGGAPKGDDYPKGMGAIAQVGKKHSERAKSTVSKTEAGRRVTAAVERDG